MKKNSPLLICLLAVCLPAGRAGRVEAGSVQFSTYYPAPFGIYDRLRLPPRSALAEPCDAGTFYYETGVGLKFCNEATQTWGSLGGGVWTQSGNNIYPSDTATNPNLTVGIRTTAPSASASLHVIGPLGGSGMAAISAENLDDSMGNGGAAIRARASPIGGTGIESTGAWAIRGTGNSPPSQCAFTGSIAGAGVAGYVDSGAACSIGVYAMDNSNGAWGNLAFLAAGQSVFSSAAANQKTISVSHTSPSDDGMAGYFESNNGYGLVVMGTGTGGAGGNVGIGTTAPGAKLEVAGQVKITGGTPVAGEVLTSDSAGLATWEPAGGTPSGAVMYFNLASCPSGWSELTIARGRYLVGLPDGGTLASGAGIPLNDREDRSVGQHNHGISDPGHAHTIESGQNIGNGQAAQWHVGDPSWHNDPTSNVGTGISINNAGAVAGTNAPYLQLLVCQKD